MSRFVLALVALCSAPAFAATPVSVALVDPLVEVTMNDGGDQRARFAVPLPPDKECSDMEVQQELWQVKLRICRNGGDAASPIIDVTLERNDRVAIAGTHTSNWTSSMKLRSTVRLAHGVSTPIGTFQPADKAHAITASLR